MPVSTLAIDCTDPICSFAIFKDNNLTSYFEWNRQSLSAEFLNELNQFLDSQKLSIQNIDQFVVCNGPGGYTALRVAISSIKGIVWATDTAVQGISKLAANAYAILNEKKYEDSHIISFHKIRDEFFIWQEYNQSDILHNTKSSQFNNYDEKIFNRFSSKTILCGDIPSLIKEKIDNKIINAKYIDDDKYKKNATIIGQLGLKRNLFDSPDNLNVLYPLPPLIHKKK
jgi:tRNA threonylcarbamoyl adenosine modification protein YeaZ